MPFRDQPMDPISRQTFARSIESLAEKFRGIFSRETVERYVHESIDRLSGARVVDFIPLFVHRFAREQLRALAQRDPGPWAGAGRGHGPGRGRHRHGRRPWR